PDEDAEAFGLRGELAEPRDGGLAVARSGEAEDRRRLEAREALERVEQRVDALPRVVRARDERQGMDRRNLRHGRRRAQTARAEELERLVVGALPELLLPDPDRRDARRGIRVNIVGEARGERAHLGDREARDSVRCSRHAAETILCTARRSSWARRRRARRSG